MAITPRKDTVTATARGTRCLVVAQSMSGITCVLMRKATISGTVAVRAYQAAPTTRTTAARISQALTPQRAITVPAPSR